MFSVSEFMDKAIIFYTNKGWNKKLCPISAAYKKMYHHLLNELGLSEKKSFGYATTTFLKNPHKMLDELYYNLLENTEISKKEFNEMSLDVKIVKVYKSIPSHLKNRFNMFYLGFLFCNTRDKQSFKSFSNYGKVDNDSNSIIKQMMVYDGGRKRKNKKGKIKI